MGVSKGQVGAGSGGGGGGGDASAANQTTEIARLTSIRDYLDTVETKLQSLIDQTSDLETNTTGLATQATLSAAKTVLDSVLAAVDGLEATTAGLATQATQLLRWGGGKSAYVSEITSSGPTVAITPASGNRIELYWVTVIPDLDNTAGNLVKVGFGPSTTITTELYRSYALSHWEYFIGAVDDRVIIDTQTNEGVAVTIHYKEVA